jgi:hypothetical protein
VQVILVESPDRFARDLAVQLAGHNYLRSLGVELILATAPSFFTEDTPTAVLVRQVLLRSRAALSVPMSEAFSIPAEDILANAKSRTPIKQR